MNPSEPQVEFGTVCINGKVVEGPVRVRLNSRSLEIYFNRRECISLYTFNSLMLPIESKREGAEQYKFTGTKLGLYHDTADVREGPYVNHYIEELQINLSYPSIDEVSFDIRGRCDLSKSSFDTYWYKGATSGDWTFEVSFVHRFPRA